MKKYILLLLISLLSFNVVSGESFPELSKALRQFMEGKINKQQMIKLIDKSPLAVKVKDLEVVKIKGVKTVRWHMVHPMDDASYKISHSRKR